MDGQTERVNQCVEAYFRSMVFQEPKQWAHLLSLAELWYNTYYHQSIKMSPFEALYHYPPPMIGELALPDTMCEAARFIVLEKDRMLKQLQQNMQVAQDYKKFYAHKLRLDRQFDVGAMVYLKIQPYRQNAFGLRGSLKLRSKYYGPYKILHKVRHVAYKL